LADAQLTPADLDYVEAHGTGTALGDPIEMSALAAVFAPQRSTTHPLQVGSVKTNLGHLEGAAGIAGLIKVTLALAHQHLPAHLHCQQLSPHIDWSQPVEVVRQARPWPTNPHRVRRAGVSSFGFGGTNAHVVLEEPPALPAPIATSPAEPAHVLLVLSAKTAPALAEQAAQWARVLTPDAPLADIAYTAAVGRAALAYRLAVIGDTPHTLQEQLQQFAQTHSASQVLQAVAAAEHRVAWIIGKTPLHAGAGDALAMYCPRFRQHWEAARQECGDILSAATPNETPDATLTPEQHLVLQVALGRFWLAMGVTPCWIVGLGQGELAAACLAGVLSLPAALRRLAVESSTEGDRHTCAAKLTYQCPTWPLLSGGRGTWVTDQVATIAYWSEPLSHALQADATRAGLQQAPPHTVLELSSATHLSLDLTGFTATDPATPPVRFAGLSTGPDAWTAHLALCAHLFVQGVPVSAEAWTSGPRRRLPLPTYPFQRERHWFQHATPQDTPRTEQNRRSATTSSGVWVHPLLGWRLNLAGREIVYETDLGHIDYLADHRVGGTMVMPATGYLELALAAGRDASFKFLEIRDLKIRRPMLLDERAPGRVHVVLAPDGAGFACRILRWTTDHWQAHATCRLEAEADNSHTSEGAITPPVVTDPEMSRSVAAHYAACHAVGLKYGPAFQGVQTLWSQGHGVARGIVTLPSNVDARGYFVHPALLDACLQVISAAFPSDVSQAWLPLKLARYRVCERASQQTKFHVRAYLHPTESASRRLVDLSITDEQDHLVAEIVGLQLQRTSLPTLPQLLFEERWVPQMRISDPVPTVPSITVARMAEHLESIRSTVVSETGFESHLHALETIEELCGHLICAQFSAQGQPFVADQSFSLAELADAWHISPQHSRLLQRLLRILTEEQLVRPERDRWVVVTTREPHDVEPQFASLVNRSPQARPEWELLRRCISCLMDVLRGTVDPLRLLFPADGSISAADIYRDSVGGRTMNALVAEAAASVAAELPAGRTLRVLEIGAGTGATTEAIQQRLQPDRTRYLFTDVAASFFPAARARFANHANMDYRVLDIERDPITQGFDSGSFDLVVAANVLHATKDLRAAVKHAASLLAPGGKFVVLEGTRPVRWLDLIFGLTSGWWRFEDRSLRPEYPLLSLDAWRRLLDEVGFGAIRVVPPLSPQQYHHDDPGSAVILSEFDATSVQLTGATHPSVKRSWWICADDSQLADTLSTWNAEHHDITRIPLAGLVGDIEPGTHGSNLPDKRSTTDNIMSVTLTAPLPTDVVLTSLSLEEYTSHDPAEWALRQTCVLLSVVQALEQRMHELNTASNPTEPQGTVRVWVVTCGAQVPHGTTDNLAQASLWGFLRTVAQEHPHWDCRLVDLDPQEPNTARMATLLDELQGPAWDCESEIRFRNGVRQARRLLRYALTEVPGHQQVLKVTSRGSLSGLNIASEPRRELSANEVEVGVHASGLNFRDVLSLLGQYPGAPPLGAECAGRIVRVGNSVTDVQVGDRVVAIAPDTFRSHVVVHHQSVVRIPDGLSLEDAATIPIAYLTAQVALFELAQLRAGMRVLIHTATGGVGQAAVHLARAVGAEIFATASPAKHNSLRQMGITHIYDSRRVGFAQQIRHATDGLGVDIVLNTLGPEFVSENARVLTDGGTYVDLTKTVPEVATSILSAQGNFTYHALDLAALLTAEPARIKASLTPLLSRVSAGELASLPRRSFALEDAEQAFRTMRAAQHVGKILLQPTHTANAFPQLGEDRAVAQRPARKALVRANATYLVTGGLGGLGLAVARWLAEQGAGQVALMARRAPTDAEQRQLAEIRRTGARIELYSGDVANADDVKSVLRSIRSTDKPLTGVFHLAGTLDDSFVQSQTVDKMTRVFSAKACGAWLLHQATLDDSLDYFVLFSSAAAAFGSAGQANHAAANAFMDALARHRHAVGLVGQSINWGPWSGIGAAAARDVAQRVGLDGIGMLTPTEGMRLFEQVLISQHPQLLAVRLEWDRLPSRWKSLPLFALLSEPKGPTRTSDQAENNFRSRLILAPANQRYQLLLSHLQALAAQTLGVKDPVSLATDQALADAGLDSLASLELSHRIEESLSTHISSTFVFDFPTLTDMANHFVQTLAAEPATVTAQASANPSTWSADEEVDPDGEPFNDALDYSPADEGITGEDVSQELQELTRELDRWGQV
jgi:acyl transferase domain-containing protein/SAM-dependent methyltransferase/acyl carrier protein